MDPMFLQILNFRGGFANNSSSSHSLIFLPDVQDDLSGSGYEFGWDEFTAASRKSKAMYLACILHEAVRRRNPSMATSVVKEWLGKDLDPDVDLSSCYVDHQSVIALPGSGTRVYREFFEELKEFLLQDGLVILGGNDNGGLNHPLKNGSEFELPSADYGGDCQARKDPKYNYWTIVRGSSGSKMRVRFARGNPLENIPDKAFAPELVDLKITNFCPFEDRCPWCYQGSGKKGKHADTGTILHILDVLSELQVFEVAIGGGEPTLHPDFVEIISYARKKGIIPNFTTKTTAWMQKKKYAELLDKIGSFAHSVDSPEEVRAFAAVLDKHYVEHEKAAVQYVMGSSSLDVLADILHEASLLKIRVTLLGYKQTGRGGLHMAKNYDDWLGVIKKLYRKDFPIVSIDTALASEYEDILLQNMVPSWCFSVAEGKFSMYIDADKGRIGPSSYCEDKDMDTVDLGKMTKDELCQHFEGW